MNGNQIILQNPSSVNVAKSMQDNNLVMGVYNTESHKIEGQLSVDEKNLTDLPSDHDKNILNYKDSLVTNENVYDQLIEI